MSKDKDVYPMGAIYIIRNSINPKVYIGQTTKSMSSRFSSHKSHAFQKNKDGSWKNNSKLQYAIRKHGKENFTIELIANSLTIDEINEMEMTLITQYDSYNNGYNNSIGGKGVRGHKRSEETKKKMSLASKGKKKSEEHIRNLKKSINSEEGKNNRREVILKNSTIIWKYNFNGEFVEEYPSISQAARDNNISASDISKCFRGEVKSAGGYLWCEKGAIPQKYIKLSSPNIQSVICYDTNKSIAGEWGSISLASAATGISRRGIGACINGTQKSAGGYIWVAKEIKKNTKKEKAKSAVSDFEIVVCYDSNGIEFGKWNSMSLAEVATGVSRKCISRCIIGKQKQAGGYIWKAVSREKVEEK